MSAIQVTSERPIPKNETPQMTGDTYFLILTDDHEAAIARAYVTKMYPGSKAKVVRELRMDRLMPRHTVIALRRDNERSPAVELVPGASGQKFHKHISPVDLLHEIREGKAIRCQDFWTEIADQEGELNFARFTEELGKSCVPATIKNYPTEKLLKLMYA